MQLSLELLAPAKNKDIGISAIDCGADAVYIAGPAFGAREAAGNSVGDIAELCRYAHRFGVKVFITVNTILFDSELEQVRQLVCQLYEAGADALIVQDLALLKLDLPPIELHASTQCAIRTVEDAMRMEALGFRRIVLERQLSLAEIEAIRRSVGCEIECFVHGAVCVSYSGNCYLSRYLTGRSANRGECIQACRSRYDLVDAAGRTLVKDRALLSVKDLCLEGSLESLAGAGVCSFKIEGRLKGASYVKNVVRHYRAAIDSLIDRYPDLYRRASFGAPCGGFTPEINATFNRGYTSLFIDGNKDGWSSGDAAKSMGEYLGKAYAVAGNSFKVDTHASIANGDGICFVGPGNEVVGMRVERCENGRIAVKDCGGLRGGERIYRNFNIKFEKELENNMPQRRLKAFINVSNGLVSAVDEAGNIAKIEIGDRFPPATNPERAVTMMTQQLSKRSGIYSFEVQSIDPDSIRHFSAAALNAFRRDLAAMLEENQLRGYVPRRREPAEHYCESSPASVPARHCEVVRPSAEKRADVQCTSESSSRPLGRRCAEAVAISKNQQPVASNSTIRHCEASQEAVAISRNQTLTCLANCSNALSRQVYNELGFNEISPAYELSRQNGTPLMTTRYCIKRELGGCPKTARIGTRNLAEPLFLLNNSRRLRLEFDCARCEMRVYGL